MKNLVSGHDQFKDKHQQIPLVRYLGPLLLSMLAAFALFSFSPAKAVHAAAPTGIVPGGAWADTSGNSVQAHGAGMIKVGDTYYWFGEDRTQNNFTYVAISCYSSTDLVHWTFRNHALTLQASGDLGPSRVVERPKVVYNASTQTFVMYLHIDSTNYSEAKVGVATSSTVDGSYNYIGSYNPGGHESRDMTVFEDTDGTAYLLYATSNNYDLNIDQLSSDYLTDTGTIYTFPNRLEAPGMFKANGLYYLISSAPTGWSPNPNSYVTATSLAGPWSAATSLAPGSPNMFASQDAFILPVVGSNTTTYVYMGDRWDSNNLVNSRYVWLPIQFNGNAISVSYHDAWNIDTGTGEWSSTTTTSYEAEASSSVLTGGARLLGCSNCSAGQRVGYIGNSSGVLQMNGLQAASTDDYLLTLYYLNGDSITRTVAVSVNGGTAVTLSFGITYSGNYVSTVPIVVHLNAGSNSISFSNSPGWGPDIDRVTLSN